MSTEGPSLVGQQFLDRYEIRAEIGRGVFGIVYRGWHKQMDKPIAIKVLYQNVEADETGFKRFHREAQFASTVVHPNIVKIYDFGVSEEGQPFIVMDCVPGLNLNDILETEQRLSQERALPIFLQICDALGHLHNHGFLHRDIKPDNMIINDTAYQKDFLTLIDFGIAKKIKEPKNLKLTAEGTVVGTPAYMSPEQVMGRELDIRSDIYSFGVLMFFVLAGKLPIKGVNPVETMTKQVQQDAPSIHEVCPEVRISPALNMVLKTALKKDPRDRQASMKDLAMQLKACL